MIQLHPKETFTIVRQLEDHTDSGTYYVQAVIRNSKTDALISTVNLDSKGSRRFTKNYIVPADPSGEGLWISILTSVYTDSGYTTKSGNYADKMESYLVQARPVFNPNYPIPTGQDISYEKIKKIISEVVSSKKEHSLSLSEIKPDFELINNAIDLVNRKIDVLNSKSVDLSPIKDEINTSRSVVSGLIQKIKIPEIDYSKIDSIVDNRISTLKDDIIATIKNNPLMSPNHREELIKVLKEAYDKNIEKYKKAEIIQEKLDELVNLAKGEDDSEEKNNEDMSPEEDKKTEINKNRINRLMKIS